MSTTVTQIPPRPKRHSSEVIFAVARAIAPKVKKWIGPDGDDMSIEHIQNILAKVINRRGFNSDGYELAKAIEAEWFEPDMELCEILDECPRLMSEEHRKLCAAWVVDNNLRGPDVESRVICGDYPGKTGIVKTNYPDGRSSVYYEALGHVTHGTGTHGCIIEWEKLKPA